MMKSDVWQSFKSAENIQLRGGFPLKKYMQYFFWII